MTNREYNYHSASKLAISLGISTVRDYKKRCHEFPELPLYPATVFKDKWCKSGSWRGFLGKEIKNIYSTFEEASLATQKLGISNSVEYMLRYKEDVRLPSNPYYQYRSKWKDKGKYSIFFNQKSNGIRKTFYDSWEEASAAAINLGIASYNQYREMYKNDPLLPSEPEKIYKDKWSVNGKWIGFLGIQKTLRYPKYETYREACQAAMKLGTSTSTGYKKKYKKDAKLHSNPFIKYSKEWVINGRWRGFLMGWCFRENAPRLEELNSHGLYIHYEEASKASRKLGILSRKQYINMYRKDPYLCSKPENQFRDVWKDRGGWPGFLATKRSYYRSLKEMKSAVQKLDIHSSNEYRKRYTEDPKLHRHPHLYYGDEWVESGRWLYIFDKRNFKSDKLSYYSSLEEAAIAARKLEIKSRKDYRKRYKEDPRLCSTPETTYAQEWKEINGWRNFLATNKNNHIIKYASIKEASKASKKLGFKSAKEYREGYRVDPLLPCAPDQFYRSEWESNGKWESFTVIV